MPGRHTDARARTRVRGRWPHVLVAVCSALTVIVVVILSTILSPSNAGRPDPGASCTGTVDVELAAPTEMIRPLRGLADELGERPLTSGGPCARLEVTSAESPQVAAALAGDDGADLPDLWMPETDAWTLAEDIPDGRLLPVGDSIAASPLVLAGDAALAEQLREGGDSWRTLITAAPTVVANPEDDGVVLAMLTAVRRTLDHDTESAYAELGAMITELNRDRVSALDTELAQAARTGEWSHAIPSTEQEVWDLGQAFPDADIRAVTPTDGAALLDYPLYAVADSGEADGRVQQAGELLAEIAGSDVGRDILHRFGFRQAPDLAPPPGIERAPSDLTLLEPATSFDAAEVLRSWAAFTVDSRVLAVVDVSGSMRQDAGERNRITLAQDSAKEAFRHFPDTTQVGLWAFSANLGDNGAHYTGLAPIEQLSTEHRAELDTAVDRLDDLVGGGTGLYNTTLAAFRSVKANYDQGRVNTVVLLTDGRNEDAPGLTLSELVTQLRFEQSADMPVSVILVGIGPGVDDRELRAIADATGGQVHLAREPSDMEQIFIDALVNR